MGRILVGTASWSDPGFVADWYPRRLAASERLHWYAQRFNLVEVNSSFYAIPKAEVVERWCAQTPGEFVFNIKLHKLLSRHSATVDTLPPDLRDLAKVKGKGRAVQLDRRLEEAVAKRLLEEIAPLRHERKLGALLLQLSPAFRPRTHQLESLGPLFDILEGYRVAIELRNRDWVAPAHLEETFQFFQENEVTWVGVDAPNIAHFTVMPAVDRVTTPELAYLRCHGRNSSGYVRGRTVAERFDHLYSRKELKEIQGRAMKLADNAGTVHVIYNNNTSHYAPTNAAEFKAMLQKASVDTGVAAEPRLEIAELPLPNTRGTRANGRHRLKTVKG